MLMGDLSFQVLVRNVPSVGGHSIPESVDSFFKRNHPEHYLGHQVDLIMSL